MLFLIFINDLPNCLSKSTPALFADDTVTVAGTSSQDIEEKLNREQNNLHSWLLANRLSLNVSKTKNMIVGSGQRMSRTETEPRVFINNQAINRVGSTKTLGVFIDENISWKTRIEQLSKKVSKRIGVLRRVKNVMSIESLERLYKTLLLPHFDYCSLLWDNCTNELKARLQKLQNKAACAITGDSYSSATNTIMKMG